MKKSLLTLLLILLVPFKTALGGKGEFWQRFIAWRHKVAATTTASMERTANAIGKTAVTVDRIASLTRIVGHELSDFYLCYVTSAAEAASVAAERKTRIIGKKLYEHWYPWIAEATGLDEIGKSDSDNGQPTRLEKLAQKVTQRLVRGVLGNFAVSQISEFAGKFAELNIKTALLYYPAYRIVRAAIRFMNKGS